MAKSPKSKASKSKSSKRAAEPRAAETDEPIVEDVPAPDEPTEPTEEPATAEAARTEVPAEASPDSARRAVEEGVPDAPPPPPARSLDDVRARLLDHDKGREYLTRHQDAFRRSGRLFALIFAIVGALGAMFGHHIDAPLAYPLLAFLSSALFALAVLCYAEATLFTNLEMSAARTESEANGWLRAKGVIAIFFLVFVTSGVGFWFFGTSSSALLPASITIGERATESRGAGPDAGADASQDEDEDDADTDAGAEADAIE